MRRIKYIVMGAAALLVQPFAALAQDVDECRALVEEQSYKLAYPICKRAAERGNAEARDILDAIHRRGIRLEDDAPKVKQGWRTSGQR